LIEHSEFRLVIEEVKQWVEQKRNKSLPPHQYYLRIKDFLANTWNRVNKCTLPHGESEELPDKIQKISQPFLTKW
jgi:hypothetical protein